MRSTAVFVLILLLAAPAADALDIGARSLKARPSSEYSPETAWDLGFYGCDVTIAIFDEGVDDKHPYLDGKVIAGIDVTGTGQAWTLANGGNPQPILGTHGTPVASLAGSHAGQPFFKTADAPQYADDDLVGIAPCAWLVDVQFNDVDGATTSDFVDAFEWAIEHKDDDWGDDDASNDGIDIITMSWSPLDGTDGSDELSQAANAAVEAGIIVLGSMGNSGAYEYKDWGTPAAADLSLGIANLWNERTIDRDDDVIRDSSTRGPRPDDGDDDPYEELKPDVATPGHGVVGTGAALADGSEYAVVCFDESDLVLGLAGYGCHYSFSGTSAATPMTAGVVALMLDANPDLTGADIKEILHQTAQPHPDQTPSFPDLNARYNWTYGWGMTDAYGAVRMALQWPGLEYGKDTDSDGIRDFLDSAPRDPHVAEIIKPTQSPAPVEEPTQDLDGDGVNNTEDAAPLDPTQTEVAEEETADKDTPFLGAVAVLGLLGIALVRRR